MPPKKFDDEYFEALFVNPPEHLIARALHGVPAASLDLGYFRWRDARIWEAYFDAASVLIEEMLQEHPRRRRLIFPALFNLRHAIEVALKWHIIYAGGSFSKAVGHDLEALVQIFRETAEGLAEEISYVSEYDLNSILEIAKLDPRGIAFRYSKELDGTPITLPHEPFDLPIFAVKVDLLSIWFDHLKGYIDMCEPGYQEMLRALDAEQAHSITPTQSSPAVLTYSHTSPG